jgi:hypothetical protein
MVFNGVADIENIEIAFRISFQFIIEREMQVLLVFRPISCISDVGQRWRLSDLSLSVWLTSKT